MKCFYRIRVAVTGYVTSRLPAIKQALAEAWVWNAEAGQATNGTWECEAEGEIPGDVALTDFADRVMQAVWAAHGTYCMVVLTATFVEEYTPDTYTASAADYNRYCKRARLCRAHDADDR